MSHTRHNSSALNTFKKEFGFLAALIFAAAIFSVGADTAKPFVSSEVKFADSSASGLSIVPASCESGVGHTVFIYNGVFMTECNCPAGTTFNGSTCATNPPPPPPPSPIPPPVTGLTAVCGAPGTTGTVNWSTVSGATSYYVRVDDTSNAWTPARCDNTINDTQTGDVCTPPMSNIPPYYFPGISGHSYNIWVHSNNASGYSAATNVAVTCSCPAGQVWNGSACLTTYSCTGAAPMRATLCSGDSTGLSADTMRTVATTCGAPKCEYTCNSGYTKSGNTCVFICPDGEAWKETACASVCPAGQVWNGTSCETPAFSCTGTTPTNSTICATDNADLTADTPKTLETSCGAPKCEYLCNSGFTKSGNTCVSNCPGGQTWNGTACVTSCSAGQTWNGSACVCPSDQTWNGSACVVFCTGGRVWNGITCACPTGQNWNGSACVGSCTDSFFCQGNDLMHQSTSCVNTLSQTCSYGCSNGTCNSQPAAMINFTVSPLLVRRGETSQVTWSTTNATSCTVTSTNGASWSGLSGTEISPAIQAQTVFTIRCTATSGAIVTQSATVNIIPTFCEQGSC